MLGKLGILLAFVGVGCGGLVKAEAGASGDAGSISAGDGLCVIHASDYDQSCGSDGDCLSVGEGNACDEPCAFECPMATINASSLAAYNADVGRTPAAHVTSRCNCPSMAGGPGCCLGGVCQPFLTCVGGKFAANVEAGAIDAGAGLQACGLPDDPCGPATCCPNNYCSLGICVGILR